MESNNSKLLNEIKTGSTSSDLDASSLEFSWENLKEECYNVKDCINKEILSQVTLSFLENKEVEEEVEADSILGSKEEKEGEEAELEEDYGGDMTQPLEMNEELMRDLEANRLHLG